jgi:hypothetical protein
VPSTETDITFPNIARSHDRGARSSNCPFDERAIARLGAALAPSGRLAATTFWPPTFANKHFREVVWHRQFR